MHVILYKERINPQGIIRSILNFSCYFVNDMVSEPLSAISLVMENFIGSSWFSWSKGIIPFLESHLGDFDLNIEIAQRCCISQMTLLEGLINSGSSWTIIITSKEHMYMVDWYFRIFCWFFQDFWLIRGRPFVQFVCVCDYLVFSTSFYQIHSKLWICF